VTALTPDALALLAALDAGDDGVLPILADLFEEAGDGRAAGLRRLAGRYRPAWAYRPGGVAGGGWRRANRLAPDAAPHALPGYLWDALPECGRWLEYAGGEAWYKYPTRSATFLALAEALAG
jgi:hypothetical protein